VLNRNPDNFFAETEQVAFCTAHIIPGIDFSNDPLLQGRIHSYLDTQISRLGGVNFHELPINAPLKPVHNNQRDGMHRQSIPRGRVAYEPNSLAGGCPFQAGMQGFTSFPETITEDKVRGRPEKFADHYSQARLFWISQSPPEQQHIINAFRFELTRVQTQAIRERVVSLLVNVDEELAAGVAAGLGIALPEAAPLASSTEFPVPPPSTALSEQHFPGNGMLLGRRVAILVADGVDGDSVQTLYDAILAEGGAPRLLGLQLGPVKAGNGSILNAEGSIETMPSVLFDAVALPDGKLVAENLAASGQTLEFLRDQYRHCKPMLAIGASQQLLQTAGIPETLVDGSPDPTLLAVNALEDALQNFVQLVGSPRSFARETDPPMV